MCLHWCLLFCHCFMGALYLKPTVKIFHSIFEKKNFLSEIGPKRQDRLNEESSNQIDILLPITHNCNDQKKIPTSLIFSYHKSKVCNLILAKTLHTIKCLFQVLQLNISNNTINFDFSIVQANKGAIQLLRSHSRGKGGSSKCKQKRTGGGGGGVLA